MGEEPIGEKRKRNNPKKQERGRGQGQGQGQGELQKPTNCCNTDSKSRRNRKEVAIFGNYRNYYGYRIGKDLEEDPRLKAMKKEWFQGKDCLDIGCNSGIVTISIAKKFCCKSILGVDIDSARTEDAHWTLRKIARRSSKMSSATDKSVVENSITELQSKLQRSNSGGTANFAGGDLFDVVSFEKGNFVGSWHPPGNKLYHAIVCLSVTKWIHLNWGDDGLITLFSKVWRFLLPGGVFIVEPQPWISYSKNRQVSETASENYGTIQIGPADFQDLLLDKIGFRTVEHINSSLSDSKAGFERPILVFCK